jgi:hypothetical protein
MAIFDFFTDATYQILYLKIDSGPIQRTGPLFYYLFEVQNLIS